MPQAFRLLSMTLSSGSSRLLTQTSAQTGPQQHGWSILTYAVRQPAPRGAMTCKAAVDKSNDFLRRTGLKCSIPLVLGWGFFFPFFFFFFCCFFTKSFYSEVYMLLKLIVEPVRFLSSAAGSLDEFGTSATTSLSISCQGFGGEWILEALKSLFQPCHQHMTRQGTREVPECSLFLMGAFVLLGCTKLDLEDAR